MFVSPWEVKVNLFAFSWRVFHICTMMTSFKHLIWSCQVLMIVASFQDHTDVRMCTHTREKNLLSHSFAVLIHLGFAWLHWKYSDIATTDSALQWANVIVLSLLCLSDLWSFHWRWYWHVCSLFCQGVNCRLSHDVLLACLKLSLPRLRPSFTAGVTAWRVLTWACSVCQGWCRVSYKAVLVHLKLVLSGFYIRWY